MIIKRKLLKVLGQHISYYRILHGIKTAIACFIGIIIREHYKLPMSQWVPITIMVVMGAQIHFGGAIHKSLMRLLGTLSGVAIAIIAIWFFHNNPLVKILVVFFSVVVFTYIASSNGNASYAGTIGGVTVILILAGQDMDINDALQRGIDIIVGIVIALLVSRLFFPFHARDQLRYLMITTLRDLNKLYLLSVELGKSADFFSYKELDAKIAKHIAQQPKLIYEAQISSLDVMAKKSFYAGFVESERNLNRLINMDYLAKQEIRDTDLIGKYQSSIASIKNTISDHLDYLANCLEICKEPSIMESLEDSLKKADLILESLDGCAQYSPSLFISKQLLKEIHRAKDLITKVNGKIGDNMV